MHSICRQLLVIIPIRTPVNIEEVLDMILLLTDRLIYRYLDCIDLVRVGVDLRLIFFTLDLISGLDWDGLDLGLRIKLWKYTYWIDVWLI